MTSLMRYGREGGNKESMSRLEFDSTALFTRAAAVAFFSMFTAVISYVLFYAPLSLKLSPSECIAWKY